MPKSACICGEAWRKFSVDASELSKVILISVWLLLKSLNSFQSMEGDGPMDMEGKRIHPVRLPGNDGFPVSHFSHTAGTGRDNEDEQESSVLF